MARHVMKALVLLTALATANAYFLMGLDFITTERLDPLVNPGKISGHVHSVVGGSNFRIGNVTTNSLRNSECTSAPIKEDKSVYWFPHLYFEHANGSFTSLNGGAVISLDYLFNDKPGTTTAFPENFGMLAGTPTLRTYDPKSFAQQAITFLCLDFNGVSTTHNELPTKKCPSGIRAQINFPSCWDGKNLDSPDHKSHVAYLSEGPDKGTCKDPKFPVTLPRIFIEVYWGSQSFDNIRSQAKNPNQPFVYSYGDPTGYGYHADFMNGWDKGVLERTVDGCNCNPFGDPQCCADKGLFTLTKGKQCRITKTVNEPATGTLPKLPGNNPVQGEGKTATSFPDTNPPGLLSPVYVYTGNTPPAQGTPVPPVAGGPSSSASPPSSSAPVKPSSSVNIPLPSSSSSSANIPPSSSSTRGPSSSATPPPSSSGGGSPSSSAGGPSTSQPSSSAGTSPSSSVGSSSPPHPSSSLAVPPSSSANGPSSTHPSSSAAAPQSSNTSRPPPASGGPTSSQNASSQAPTTTKASPSVTQAPPSGSSAPAPPPDDCEDDDDEGDDDDEDDDGEVKPTSAAPATTTKAPASPTQAPPQASSPAAPPPSDEDCDDDENDNGPGGVKPPPSSPTTHTQAPSTPTNSPSAPAPGDEDDEECDDEDEDNTPNTPSPPPSSGSGSNSPPKPPSGSNQLNNADSGSSAPKPPQPPQPTSVTPTVVELKPAPVCPGGKFRHRRLRARSMHSSRLFMRSHRAHAM